MALRIALREQVRTLVFKRGKLLLLRSARSPNPSHVGKWEVPGGFVHPDEEPRRAALREVKEETGLDVKILFELHPFVEEEWHDKHIVRVFTAIGTGGKMKLSAEHSDYQWAAIERIPHITDAIRHEKLVEYVQEAQRMLAHAGLAVS